MTSNIRPDAVQHLESDFKGTANHFEKTDDGAEVYYPETLRQMHDPPTIEMIKLGEQVQAEDQMRGLWATLKKDRRMLLMVIPYLIACIGQGYDGGASGITLTMPSFLIKFGAFDPVTKSLFIPSRWLSGFTGATQAGITLGAFACSWLLDRFGPRRTNFGTSAFMLIPVAIQTLAVSPAMLLVGKLLGGIPQGIFVVAASNYIAEASSIRMRGPLSALMAMQLIAGIVFGLTAGYERFLFFTSDWLSWRMVLAIQWIFPVLTVFGLLFVTDSPVYQLRRGNTAQSIATLARLYPRETSERIRARLATIQHGVAIEQEAAAKQGEVSIKDLFATPIDRRRTFISIGTWVVFQFGGSAFTSNGLYFLTQQGIAINTVFTITICMIALSALINLGSVVLLEKIGRRGCFVYLNMLHCAVLTIVGALAFSKSHTGGIAMAIVLNLAISTQQVATGGSSYAINSEVSSMRLRSKTQSVGLVVNYLLGMVFVFVVPYMFQPDSGNLGAKTAFIFAGLTFLGILWSYFCVPETKGRSALELDALFEAGVPARQFRKTDVTSLDLSGHGHHAA